MLNCVTSSSKIKLLEEVHFKLRNFSKYAVFKSDKLNSNAIIEYMEEMDKLRMIIMEMLAHGLDLGRKGGYYF